ncbi:MAG: hypothetical protein K0U21_04815 [Proteobacteria bacterium]|nr:hypothetical protein [Pseudomonadota bacterium]
MASAAHAGEFGVVGSVDNKSTGEVRGSSQYADHVMQATEKYIEHTENVAKHLPNDQAAIHKKELSLLDAAKKEQAPNWGE